MCDIMFMNGPNLNNNNNNIYLKSNIRSITRYKFSSRYVANAVSKPVLIGFV